uniref:CHK kinase-like domain-containing protein n=1 Tax=Plectus sambesii TaxID=2011161 RepID=A0A914XT47_9BILA
MAPSEHIESATTTDSLAGLFGTTVTLECLERRLQDVLSTSATFGASVSTEQIGYGLGFLSVMVRLKPDWQGEKAEELPKSLAVKIPSSVTIELFTKQANWEEKHKDGSADFDMEKLVKGFAGVLHKAHASEVTYYDMVKKDGLKLKVPKVYLADHYGPNGENGLLIMEDLGNIATTKPLYETLSVESIKVVLDNLAEVHAYSLQNDQWLSNPDLKMTFGKFQKQSGNSFEHMIRNSLNILKKDHPVHFDPLIDRLVEICKEKLDFDYTDTVHEKLGLPPVMTHGDLWSNNMMWRKTEDGKGTTGELAAIVDWQLVHPGCIGEDFVRLLCTSAGTDVRREHLEELFQHYHTSLKAKMGKEPPFTVAQIIHAYKHLFRYGVLMVLPMFEGFVQADLGMMGTENVEQHRQDMLSRAKCLVDDLYEIEDELALEKA